MSEQGDSCFVCFEAGCGGGGYKMKIVFLAMGLMSQKSEKHSSNQLVTELSKGASVS